MLTYASDLLSIASPLVVNLIETLMATHVCSNMENLNLFQEIWGEKVPLFAMKSRKFYLFKRTFFFKRKKIKTFQNTNIFKKARKMCK